MNMGKEVNNSAEKKEYVAPQMSIVDMSMTTLLCASLEGDFDYDSDVE